MSATPKKKLCWNCEGRVSLEEENCPYCAVYLGPAPAEGVQDLLAPPYRIVESEDEEDNIPASPYATRQNETNEVQETVDLSSSKSVAKKIIFPLAFLSAGSMLLLFGFILLFFSERGSFTLTWNAEYWHYYLLLAAPMLLIGWKSLQNSEEEVEEELAPEPVKDETEQFHL